MPPRGWCVTERKRTMEAMTLVLDDREWTLAERDALPDDGGVDPAKP